MRVLLLVLALAGCAGQSETPAPVAAPDTSAPQDPADAVRKYYAFLEAKDYPRAYAMWGEGGLASKQTYEQFAAGSSFAEVRVRVDATTTGGQEQKFGGAYVVRRTNDVPGATDAQLRWHFDAARLDTLP